MPGLPAVQSAGFAEMAWFLGTDWEPLVRFSIFRFGDPIQQYLSMGEDTLHVEESEHTSKFESTVRGKYYSPDACCYVEGARGSVHQITTYDSCLVQGMNIVGSKMGPVLSLLNVTQPRWYVPYPHAPIEKVTVIPSLGLELVTSLRTGTVCRVTLRPGLPEYANDEEAVRRYMGNVVDIRHARRGRRWGRRFDIKPYRPFDSDF